MLEGCSSVACCSYQEDLPTYVGVGGECGKEMGQMQSLSNHRQNSFVSERQQK